MLRLKYLLDTDICILLIRQQPEKLIKQLIRQSVQDVCISAITLAELECGVAKGKFMERNRKALNQFLLSLSVYDFGQEAAQCYGQLRMQLESKGKPIGSMDMLIAAHALSLDAVLVTRNIKEFQRVPELKIESWV
jgi:tRNA(fMet)-specific endonuclease VapC